jgi:two-component system response regulator YesN
MLNLLIVEDEYMMREGLGRTFPWETWGCSLVGTAENGTKAVDILKMHPMDMVITDIRMPSMDGLELLKYIKEQYPLIKVILLSGYEDFKYAREGLRYGASGYVLKLNLLKELKQEVDKAREEIISSKLMLEDYQISHTIVTQEIMRRTLIGERNSSFLNENSANSLEGISYKCMVIHIKNYYMMLKEMGLEQLSIQINEIEAQLRLSAESMKLEFHVIRVKENELVLIINRSLRTDEQLNELLIEATIADLMKSCAFPVVVGIGDYQQGLNGIVLSYQDARFLTFSSSSYDNTLRYDLAEYPNKHALPEGLLQIEKKILIALEINDKHDTVELTNEWFQAWRELAEINIPLLQQRCLELLTKYVMRFNEMFNVDKEIDNMSLLDIINYEDIDTLNGWFKTKISLLFHHKIIIKRSDVEDRIDRIVKYIHLNAHDKITLKQMAEFVYLNPSYLSVLFKEKTGKSFTDYLIELKIKLAAAYIREGLKVHEAAIEVGYEDLKHFRKMFFKYMGTNPGKVQSENKIE